MTMDSDASPAPSASPEASASSSGGRRPLFSWRTGLLLAVGIGLLIQAFHRPSSDGAATRRRPSAGASGVDGAYVHHRLDFGVMTTEANLRVFVDPARIDGPVERALAEAAWAVYRVDALMNPYRAHPESAPPSAVLDALDAPSPLPSSDVVRLNNAPEGEWVSVDAWTWTVAMAALRMHALSDGAFDPTIGPLKALYPYPSATAGPVDAARPPEAAESVWPDEDTVNATLQRVGAQYVEFDADGRRLRFTRPGMRLDLSAVAKGFAVDQAMEALQRRGVADAMVSVGGELRLSGWFRSDAAGLETADVGRQRVGGNPSASSSEGEATSPSGGWAGSRPEATRGARRWWTGIQHPRGTASSHAAVLERTDCAVATSGDYARGVVQGGRRRSHIVDPRTGRPLTGGLVGVTVLTPGSCLLADAVSTTLTVLGPEAGERFLGARADDLFREGLEIWWFEASPTDPETVVSTVRWVIPGPGLAAMGVRMEGPQPARVPRP